jgi:hypothetical protein
MSFNSWRSTGLRKTWYRDWCILGNNRTMEVLKINEAWREEHELKEKHEKLSDSLKCHGKIHRWHRRKL